MMRLNGIIKIVRGQKMELPKLIIGLAVICLTVITLMSCSSGTTGITKDEAVVIAKDKVVSDAIMTLTDRDEVVVDEGANWHISFPLKASLDTLGGEPHIKVSKADGTIVETYYTQ